MFLFMAVAMAGEGATGVGDAGLAAVLDEAWEARMLASPTFATQLGDHRYDDRIDDNRPEAVAAWSASQLRWRDTARGLSPANEQDRLSQELFIEEVESAIAVDQCRFWTWSVSARENELVFVSSLAESHPLDDPKAGADLLERVAALPAHIDQASANLRVGAAEGMYANAASVRIVLAQVDAELARPVEESTLWRVTGSPAMTAWPAAKRRAFASALRRQIERGVQPALRRYATTLREEILPRARPDGKEGLAGLPNGAECYSALIRKHTTLTRSPDALHQAGLDALVGIHAEMRALGARLFGTEDLVAIGRRLREDPALHFTTEDEVEATAAAALARAKAAMPRFFDRRPVADCTVARIPVQEAPYTTIAYYWPAVPGGEKPGQYFVNTWAPTTRTRYEAEALAWHEAIPGHHLQIALAQELPALPAFRRHAYVTAYAEGWALYTERLADEMGLYSGDLDRMGMYSFDAWRAARLVVDTGLHNKGWTREQAVQFMLANTMLAENNIRNEVDRYLTDPGQALAYKTGQIEIFRLRREAEAALGDRFRLASFHGVVLDQGSMTLPALERRVRAWVATF